MVDQQLTEHFSLNELIRSSTASRRGIRNTPTPAIITSLTLLCQNVLEPVRLHYGRPVIITSGYRSPALNKAIGGSSTSQHCKGEAADFTVVGQSNMDVCRWIVDNLAFDQLIYEYGEAGWVHCSWTTRQTRRSVLSAKRNAKGGTDYLVGLVR